MSLTFSTALRNARLQAIVDTMDAAVTNGEILFYAGTRPATGAVITNEVLVAETLLSKPSGTISNGVLTFDTIEPDIDANAAETITWARIVDGDGNFIIDADCGLTGSGADFIFNITGVELSGIVKVLSASITEGGV